MQVAIAYTVLIWGVVFGISWAFNRAIDAMPAGDRPDGLTAYWVVIGCSYALAAAAMVMALWQPFLPAGPLLFGLVTFGLCWVTFGVAGVPMLAGDIRRAHSARRRRVNEQVLAEARRVLERQP